jgi:uncharacterized surface protein with fasciclin (FAS1) repeats
MKTNSGWLLASAGLLAFAACDSPQPDPRINLEEEEVVQEEPAGPAVMEVLGSRDDLSTISQLFEQVNMAPALEGARDYTLLAPTDEAFATMEETAREFLLSEENARSLREVLGYHLLRSNMSSEALAAGVDGGAAEEAVMTTSNSYQLTASRNEDGNLVISDGRGNQAMLVATDISTANGTVHVIDQVLLPPEG